MHRINEFVPMTVSRRLYFLMYNALHLIGTRILSEWHMITEINHDIVRRSISSRQEFSDDLVKRVIIIGKWDCCGSRLFRGKSLRFREMPGIPPTMLSSAK